jgi:hypothetical protein
MEKKIIPLLGVLVFAIIIATLIVPIEGCQNIRPASADEKSPLQIIHTSELFYSKDGNSDPATASSINADPVFPNVKESQDLDQHYDIAQNLLKYMDLTNNWDKIKELAQTTIDSLQKVTRQAIDFSGNAVSIARQAIDRPTTIISEKILTNQWVMNFTGIQKHDHISDVTGTVNVYVVNNDGLLAGIMNRIINLVGCKKAGGGAIYPIGIFVTSYSSDSAILAHEYCHYFQQSVFGFSGWFALYSGEILLKTTLTENICISYKECTWEIAANDWAQRCV